MINTAHKSPLDRTAFRLDAAAAAAGVRHSRRRCRRHFQDSRTRLDHGVVDVVVAGAGRGSHQPRLASLAAAGPRRSWLGAYMSPDHRRRRRRMTVLVRRTVDAIAGLPAGTDTRRRWTAAAAAEDARYRIVVARSRTAGLRCCDAVMADTVGIADAADVADVADVAGLDRRTPVRRRRRRLGTGTVGLDPDLDPGRACLVVAGVPGSLLVVVVDTGLVPAADAARTVEGPRRHVDRSCRTAAAILQKEDTDRLVQSRNSSAHRPPRTADTAPEGPGLNNSVLRSHRPRSSRSSAAAVHAVGRQRRGQHKSGEASIHLGKPYGSMVSPE